jgi:hypothetical protein
LLNNGAVSVQNKVLVNLHQSFVLNHCMAINAKLKEFAKKSKFCFVDLLALNRVLKGLGNSQKAVLVQNKVLVNIHHFVS